MSGARGDDAEGHGLFTLHSGALRVVGESVPFHVGSSHAMHLELPEEYPPQLFSITMDRARRLFVVPLDGAGLTVDGVHYSRDVPRIFVRSGSVVAHGDLSFELAIHTERVKALPLLGIGYFLPAVPLAASLAAAKK